MSSDAARLLAMGVSVSVVDGKGERRAKWI